jgi:DNA-binding NtrC family response regulator/tetratricopeptide (TPR) repeat protein
MSTSDPLEIRALADVLRASGATYRQEGDFARAAEFFRKSLEIRERLAERVELAASQAELAKVLVLLGEIDEAAALAHEALRTREELGDGPGVAECHDLLGNVARGQGRPGEAEGHYAKALTLKRDAGDDAGVAGTLALYGLLHSERGNWDDARERYEAALAIFERLDDPEQVASLTNNLGNLCLRRGDLNGAAERLERARDLFAALDDRRGVGKCLNNLAGIYRALGQDGKSAESFRKALSLFEAMGDKRGAAIAANNLAVIEQDFGHYAQASPLHQRSLELKREMGDRAGEAASLGNLGDVAWALGDWTEADRLYREALRILEKSESKATQGIVLNHRARLFLHRGDAEAAGRDAAAARKIGAEIGSREIEAESRVVEILGALASGDAGSARRALDEAEELARNMRSRETEALVRRVRAEVLAAEGRPDEAESAFDESARAFKRLRRAHDLAWVDLARGRSWARAGRGDRCVEPFARAERALEEIGGAAHVLRPLAEALDTLDRTHPGDGRELGEMGMRLALRLGDEDTARSFRASLERIAEVGSGRDDARQRLRTLADLAARLLRRPDASEFAARLLEVLLDEVRGDRGVLLLRAPRDETFEIIATPGFEDPGRTDAVREAERAASTGEVLRDFRGGDRTSPRSRLVVPFGEEGADGLRGVANLESSPGTRGFGLRGDPARIAVKRRERPEAFADVVGDSKRMVEVYDTARKVAPGTATVLILGESGTGKELLARAIHRMSPRRDASFIAVNCPSIPRDLLESELFGYEKGAFTGADQTKEGRLELAHGGTLFLDELGDLPFAAQAKLLRVLQERTFERLGGLETLRVDVRILAATSVDLAQAVAERRFREDLYYRLNVVPVVMPALRDRPEDVPALVEHFLAEYAIQGKPVRYVTPEALRLMTAYPWPGNVRELENAIQYAVNLMDGDTLRPGDLPRPVRSFGGSGSQGAGSLQSEMDRLERDLIIQALEETQWNRSEAARRLGTTESKIRQRMKKHGLAPPSRTRPRGARRIPRRTPDFGDSAES